MQRQRMGSIRAGIQDAQRIFFPISIPLRLRQRHGFIHFMSTSNALCERNECGKSKEMENCRLSIRGDGNPEEMHSLFEMVVAVVEISLNGYQLHQLVPTNLIINQEEKKIALLPADVIFVRIVFARKYAIRESGEKKIGIVEVEIWFS